MTSDVLDPQYESLTHVSSILRDEYLDKDDAWVGSPFEWLKSQPSRRMGAITESLITHWLQVNGFSVRSSPDSDADRLVSGIRVEIKSSTLWASGHYRFQQIRDQNYQIVLCIGLSPFEAHFWAIPKKVLMEGWGTLDGLGSQHGGQEGRDTAWLTVEPHRMQPWLRSYGGSLSQGLLCLREQIR